MTRDESGSTTGTAPGATSPRAVFASTLSTASDLVGSPATSVAMGFGAVASFLWGLRSLERDRRLRGLVQVGLGLGLAWVTVGRLRRSSETPENGSSGRSIAIQDVPGDLERTDELGSGSDRETGGGGPGVVSESVDRRVSGETGGYRELGRAAYDQHSHEVPVPQQAFDLDLLALGAEAFWGVRDDDAVLVSERYDPIQEDDELRYVGSSDVDDERILSVPDVVTDHWDAVAGGGPAVTSGTDLVFLTGGVLEEYEQVLVVPEQWVEDLTGE